MTWDNSGTGWDKRDRKRAKVFLKIREKREKVGVNSRCFSQLHFSYGREKRVKKQ